MAERLTAEQLAETAERAKKHRERRMLAFSFEEDELAWRDRDALLEELAAVRAERDPMALQPMLEALQCADISTGKAREVIREWLAGETKFDLPDDVVEDEMNIDHVRARLVETGAAYEKLVEAVKAIGEAASGPTYTSTPLVPMDVTRVTRVLAAVNAALDLACGAKPR